MNKEELKNIQAPKKENGLTYKQRRMNTYIFTAVSSIVNLFFMIALTVALLCGFSILLRTIKVGITEEEFSKYTEYLMWAAVIGSIAFSLWIQKFVIRLVIKIFKWEYKFDESFVEKYCGKKKKD